MTDAKTFSATQVREAVKHVKGGGVAIHFHRFVLPNSPQCFKDAIKRGEYIAHVLCKDKAWLVELAKRCGIRKVLVDKEGTDRQHVDFCGTPLKNLLRECRLDVAEMMYEE